tara:strand:+ start:1001 stop:1408 length:408 start_codon:yes stop_codon:yes gene_type:complete
MSKVIIEYLEALERLVDRGVKPTLNAVAIEAGKPEGSIRRKLPRHEELVKQIDEKAKAFVKEAEDTEAFKQEARIEKLTGERKKYKQWYDNLLAKHVGAIYQLEDQRIEIFELREQLGEQIAEKKASGTLINLVK